MRTHPQRSMQPVLTLVLFVATSAASRPQAGFVGNLEPVDIGSPLLRLDHLRPIRRSHEQAEIVEGAVQSVALPVGGLHNGSQRMVGAAPSSLLAQIAVQQVRLVDKAERWSKLMHKWAFPAKANHRYLAPGAFVEGVRHAAVDISLRHCLHSFGFANKVHRWQPQGGLCWARGCGQQ
mmetsp:Transcript_14818/g.33714  ORF Transcript_14818/g.33714 Transcript_14818/m.33714 type:complete len:178 (-) Transcript_14818:1328-1861(-)